MHAAVKFLFGGGETRHFSLYLGEFEFIGRQLVLGGGLLRKQALQGIVTALQAIAFSNGLGQIAGSARGIVRASAGTGSTEIVLRFQQTGASLCQQSSSVFYIELQEQLAFFNLLTFQHRDIFHECIELRPNDGRRNGFNFAVAADGRNDIFARRLDRGELGHRLTAAEQEQQVGQNTSREKNEQDTIAKSAIHDPLYFCTSGFVSTTCFYKRWQNKPLNPETGLRPFLVTAHVYNSDGSCTRNFTP